MTSVEKVSQWIELFGEMITENREHLNKLDTDKYEREKQEMNEQPKDNKSTDDVDWLPF